MKAEEKYNFYFLLIILLILLYLAYLLVENMIIALFLGSFFALVFYPYYEKLNKKFYKPTLNSLFIVTIVNLFMILVVIITAYFLIEETSSIIVRVNSNFVNNSVSVNHFCSYHFCSYFNKALEGLYLHSKDIIIKLNSYVYSLTYKIFNVVTSFLIGYFIFVLSFFFFLRDGKVFMDYIDSILPMREREKKELYKKTNDVIHAVFVDSILIALVQGSLVGIMFWILGIEAPVLWTIVASFFALIPTLGTFLVWLPAVFYLFFKKEVVSAIILLIWGSTVVSYIDNLLRPIMINSKIKVHSFLIFLSILGGISYFGLIGLFLGPIIITLLILFLKFFREDFMYLNS